MRIPLLEEEDYEVLADERSRRRAELTKLDPWQVLGFITCRGPRFC